jgi:site-specific DNA recombinase
MMPSPLRCAVYARYSSDRQSPASIEDQVRKCSEFAERHGWQILDGHIYSDAAISGATSERAGLKRLMAAAAAKSFDVVLVDDSSRLSRKLADALNLAEQLRFAGIRLIFCSQGIDSDSEQGEILSAVHGIVDSLYIRELGKKTARGLEGRVLRSLHAGGKIFGYRSVPIEDSERRDNYGRRLISGARLAVNPEEAKIVRKLFELYANGLSIKSVTKQLNREGVRSPNPRAGRQRSWSPSSVRHILRNERYRGIVTWGKTRKVRNPANGRRINRHRPEAEWTRVEVPEQRILSDALWNRVQERLAYVNRVFGDHAKKGGLLRSRAASSRYLFSGFLKCELCGSNLVIVSGAGRNHRAADYGCPAHALRGTCANASRIPSDVLERELLQTIQSEVLSDVAIDYVLSKLETEIEKSLTDFEGELDSMRRRKAVLESELENLGQAFATGFDSPTIRAEITKREKEIAGLVEKTAGRKKGSVRSQARDLRRFVTESLRDVRKLLAGNSNNLKMELAKYVDAITIGPEENRKINYRGGWKLIGNSECAEGQNRTAYAGLFRAALYR